MHFRQFSVKKYPILPIFSDFAAFSDFFTDFFLFDNLLNFGLPPPPPHNPRFPTGPSLSFSIKNKEKIEKKKIGFPMPTSKNGFQILNLHPKKHVCFFFLNTLFFNVLLPMFYQKSFVSQKNII